MKITVDRRMLEQIYEASKTSYLDQHNFAVPAHVYHITCILTAFAEVACREGHELEIQTPIRKPYEPSED